MNSELETLLNQVIPNQHGLIDIPAFSDKICELLKAKDYTHLEMEAALCVWECLCDWTLGELAEHHKDWVELREGVGSVELRHQSIVLGKWCLLVYNICTKRDRDFFAGVAYDWEVIPLILSYARNRDGEPVIYEHALPEPELVAPFVAYDHLLTEFVSQCKHEAEKQWAYGALVVDDCKAPGDYSATRVLQAFQLGEEPAAFAKWLGEKYNLIPREEWA